MRSRGIKEEDAKQLLIDAYLNDVITKIDDDIGLAYIHTLKNRHTNIRCEYLLLDTTIIKEF